jgi:HAD superfamily hydrolase (TIGR01509 family)
LNDARRAVLFDVDGTLVDSNYLHTIAWSRALRDAGEWAPMNAIHRLIGMGGDVLVPTLIGRSDDAIRDGWRAHYDPMLGEVVPFPGAHDLLRDLRHDGVAVVLATSSPQDHLEVLLDVLEARGVIDAATSADDVDASKPDPEIFLTAMGRVGAAAEATIVVGDSRWDVEAALAARLRCIGVESGGFSEAELLEAGATVVFRDVDALRAACRDGLLDELG